MSLERVPPHNIEAEIATITSLLLDRQAIDDVINKLNPEIFYKKSHELIVKAIITLYGKGEPVDLITLTEELRKQSNLEIVGGSYYLTSLFDNSLPSTVNIEYYLNIVRDKAELRKLIHTANEIQVMGYSDTEDVHDVIDKSEKMIFEIAEKRLSQTEVKIRDILRETMNNIEKLMKSRGELTGVSTGFKDFDFMTGGLQKSELIIVAARPSMGKTAFCLNIASNAAIRSHKKVLIFSLEMSSTALVQSVICSEAGIGAFKIQKGTVNQKEWQHLTQSAASFQDASVWIDDSADCSYMEMRAKARRLKAKNGGLDLIIIDYIQLISSPAGKNHQNRQNEMADISRNLKIIARELEVPVIALSQLSRKVEDRSDSVPVLSDLRDSGAIEQDADLVAFLHRPDYYERDRLKSEDEESGFGDRNLAKPAMLIVAKQRNGPVGTVRLSFLADTMQFRDFIDASRGPQNQYNYDAAL